MALLKFGHLKIEMTIRSPSRDPEQAGKYTSPVQGRGLSWSYKFRKHQCVERKSV